MNSEPAEISASGTILYDADCGFCTSSARWLRDHGTCGVQPWQITDLAAIGLTEGQVSAEVYWLDTDGQPRASGAGAIAEAAKTCGHVFRLAGNLMYIRPLRPAADWAYRTVAANRHRLPGSTDACRMDGP